MARVKAQLLAHDRTDARRLVANDAVRRDFVSRPDGDTDSLASGSDDESAGALELYMHLLRACALSMECSLRLRQTSPLGGKAEQPAINSDVEAPRVQLPCLCLPWGLVCARYHVVPC